MLSQRRFWRCGHCRDSLFRGVAGAGGLVRAYSAAASWHRESALITMRATNACRGGAYPKNRELNERNSRAARGYGFRRRDQLRLAYAMLRCFAAKLSEMTRGRCARYNRQLMIKKKGPAIAGLIFFVFIIVWNRYAVPTDPRMT